MIGANEESGSMVRNAQKQTEKKNMDEKDKKPQWEDGEFPESWLGFKTCLLVGKIFASENKICGQFILTGIFNF